MEGAGARIEKEAWIETQLKQDKYGACLFGRGNRIEGLEQEREDIGAEQETGDLESEVDGRGRKHCPVSEGVGIRKGEVKNGNVCGDRSCTQDFWYWRERGGGTCTRGGIK